MKKTLCVLLSLLLLLGMTSLAQADEAMTLRLWVRYDDDFSDCIADFEALCQKLGIEVRERLAFDEAGQPVTDDPNLNGSLAFYRLGRAS